MRYDGSALGSFTGLGLDAQLRRILKCFLYYYIALASTPTKRFSNYVFVLDYIPMYNQLAKSQRCASNAGHKPTVTRSCCSKPIHMASQLHSTTLALPALLHIPLLFFLPQRHTLPSLLAFNGYILLAPSMDPSQSLSHPTIHVVHADGPLTTADFHGGVVAWEVEFWQEDLRRYVFSGSRLTFER